MTINQITINYMGPIRQRSLQGLQSAFEDELTALAYRPCSPMGMLMMTATAWGRFSPTDFYNPADLPAAEIEGVMESLRGCAEHVLNGLPYNFKIEAELRAGAANRVSREIAERVRARLLTIQG